MPLATTFLSENADDPDRDDTRQQHLMASERRLAARSRAGGSHGAHPYAVEARLVDAQTAPAEEPDSVGAPAVTALGMVESGGLEVHRLQQLRPVPPRSTACDGSASGASVEDSVEYNPFTARRRMTPQWVVTYTAAVVASDIVAAGFAVVVAAAVPLTESQPRTTVGVAAVLLWSAILALVGAYAERWQGTGADEYRRVVDAALIAVAILGVTAVQNPGQGLGRLLLIGAPVALVLTLAGRTLNRRRLHYARRRGNMTKSVVVVGPDAAVLDLVRRIRRDPTSGLRVVGACVPTPTTSSALERLEIPVLGALRDAVSVLDDNCADCVLIATSWETAGDYLRDLTWRLEGTNVEVLVGAGLVEVAPNRLQVRPTMSMPLIRIREPEFRGFRRVVKEVFDRVAAVVLLAVCAPVFLVIACLIKATSPGPVLYRHRRVGRFGRDFDLLKFRSMVPDADRHMELLADQNEGNEVQFKMRQDPRVTRVGRVLRRYSLDELPQLINVLKGDMSLVGPRPHVTREVEMYGPDMRRRLLVKPGITGLWQVSGRSDLGWDDAVELDVRYVGNWSLGLDLIILWRTLRAVIHASGAY